MSDQSNAFEDAMKRIFSDITVEETISQYQEKNLKAALAELESIDHYNPVLEFEGYKNKPV